MRGARWARGAMIAAAVALAAGLTTSGGAVALPPPSTPHVFTWATSWGAEAPRTGNPHGTLMGSDHVRSTQAPATEHTIADIGGQPFATRYADSVRVTTDDGLAGLSADGVLWLLDLADGTSRSRPGPALGAATTLLGTTDGAWVTGPAGHDPVVHRELTLWPFDGTASRTLTLPGSTTWVLAGTAGVAALDVEADPSVLDLVDPVGLGVTALDSWPRQQGAPTLLSMSGDAVGWDGGGRLGLWEPGAGTRWMEDTVWWSVSSVVAVPGGLVVVASDWDWGDETGFVVPEGTGLRYMGGTRTEHVRAWSSATPTGEPAVQAARGLPADWTAGPTPIFWSWSTWSPTSSAWVDAVPRTYPTAMALIGGSGAVGSMALRYWAAPGRAVLWIYAGTSEAKGSSVSYAVATSGWRSALAERSAAGDVLSLRFYRRVTARIPVAVRSLAMSGSLTAFAPASGSPLRVVGLAGELVATGPAAVLVAQDGTRTAYATSRGVVGLLDDTAPASSRNPRAVAGLCRASAPRCISSLWLSGRWIVAQLSAPSRLVAVDVVTGARRALALGTWTAASVSGPVVLVRGLPLPGPFPPARTINLAARTLSMRSIATAPDALLLSGRLVGRPSGVLPNELDWPTGVTLTPLPVANGALGRPRVLGPWSLHGGYASTSFAWRPQIMTTDPWSTWSLVLRSSTGRIVGRWSGRTAYPQYDVAGIAWAARDLTGRPVRAGLYRWTFTGTSAYGAPVSVLGSGTATGLVRVVHQSRSTLAISATSLRSGTTRTATVVARLRVATGSVVGGARVQLWRRIGSGAWRHIDDGVTSATGAVVWRTMVTATSTYQVRHAADPRAAASASATVAVRR